MSAGEADHGVGVKVVANGGAGGGPVEVGSRTESTYSGFGFLDERAGLEDFPGSFEFERPVCLLLPDASLLTFSSVGETVPD